MTVSNYKLSERAALAALGTYSPPRAPMKISQSARIKASVAAPGRHAFDARPIAEIFAPYKPFAEVKSEHMDAVSTLAMDACTNMASAVSSWASAGNALFHEGQGFLGYQYLAELIQRAEYRHASDIVAEHCVRKFIKFTGGKIDEAQKDPTAEKRKKIEEEFTRLDIRTRIQELIFQDQAFGRGQVFLDFGDADNEEEIKTPLLVDKAKVSRKRPLKRVTTVEPMWVSPGMYSTTNPLRHDFYRPRQWFVYGRIVDASRLLTVVSRPVSDMLKPAYNFGGQSLTQIMKPYVDNWLRTRQSVSDLIDAFSVLALKSDLSSLLGGGDCDDVYARADAFVQTRNNRGLWLLDKDSEELESLAVPLSNLDKLQAQSQEQMASAARQPLSIYLQITPTGLNASNDGETRNFYADIHSYNEKNIRPVLKAILDLVQLSLFDEIDPAINFEFLPLWEMSDKDKAEIRKADAEADRTYVDAGIVSNEEARQRLGADEASLYFGVDLTDPAPTEPDEELTDEMEA